MSNKKPAIELIEDMWRETTDTPMPESLRNTIENLFREVWVEGHREGHVEGWNDRNELEPYID